MWTSFCATITWFGLKSRSTRVVPSYNVSVVYLLNATFLGTWYPLSTTSFVRIRLVPPSTGKLSLKYKRSLYHSFRCSCFSFYTRTCVHSGLFSNDIVTWTILWRQLSDISGLRNLQPQRSSDRPVLFWSLAPISPVFLGFVTNYKARSLVRMQSARN